MPVHLSGTGSLPFLVFCVTMAANKKEQFGSRFAVIMAMAGSAIGLGNIWRFPYIAGEMGGGSFLFIYIICTILFSLPIFITESAIGRRSGLNAADALFSLSGGNKLWKWAGSLMIICPVIILFYYSVVGGWSIAFLGKALSFSYSNTDPAEVSELFSQMSSDPFKSVGAHLIFIALTAWIVSRGVKSGVEKFNKLTVPVLFVMILLIMLYSFSLPGAEKGINYLLKFDVNALNFKTFTYALGQSFYSISLGMGTIITYGAYVRKKENLVTSGMHVAGFDLFFAIMCAFAIMPAVFAAGLEPCAGPGLIFQSIPYIFSCMGAEISYLSDIVAILFFITVLVAAVTSSVSMFEVGIAFILENSRMNRKQACTLLFGIIAVVGSFCALGFGPLSWIQILGMDIFSLMDWFASNVLLILTSLLTSIFAGWVMSRKDFCDEVSNNGTLKANNMMAPIIHFIIKWIAPLVVATIFISNFVL